MRIVICHYHIYKNSGTTFDKLLSDNYGKEHICFDGPFPFFSIDQEQLIRIIERKPNVRAFSSHQIQLPVPVSLDFNVLPVVFIRHPLLRIQSIYNFKRKTKDGTSTSKAAMSMSFEEWVNYCFSDRQEITHISNAQTRLLGSGYRQRPLMRRRPESMEYDLNQAIRNIKNVTLLARTEYFDEDVADFPGILEGYGVEFIYKKVKPQNTTSKDYRKPINDRLESLVNQLKAHTYERLVSANEQDMKLFEYASRLIEAR